MKHLYQLFTLGLFTLTLAGCPGHKSKSGPVSLTPTYGTCTNCQFQQTGFGSSVTSSLPQGSLTLNFLGDQAQLNALSQYGQNPLFAYQGAVSMTGQLTLTSDLYMGQCRVPVGQYQLQAVQSGQYNMGLFQMPALQLVGPAHLVVTLAEGVILTDGYGHLTGFGAVLYAQQGPSAWNFMGGPANSPGMVACGDMLGIRF